MAVSRPFLIALVGVVLAAVAYFAVQQTRSGGTETAATPSSETQAPAPAEPADLSPEEALRSAVTNDVDSGRFDLEASLTARGQTDSLRVSGAVDGSAKEPAVDVQVRVRASDTSFDGGFVTTGGKAWFVRGDTGYLVPENVWASFTANESRAPAQPTPLQQLGGNPEKWVKDLESEGTETIDGVETQHVSASIDVPAAAKDLWQLALPALRQQGATPVPDAAAQGQERLVEELEKRVERADFDVWVGKEDKILRRLTAELRLALPTGPVTASLALNLTDVGRPQQIEPPAKVSRQLPGGEFGTFVQTLLAGSAAVTGGDPALVRAGLQGADNPRKLRAALRKHQKVALFFANPRGLDDRAVARSLDAVRRDTKAVVLTDVVSNVDRYGDLVENLGVSETPAVVVIDRRGKARLVEGYVDGESLVQVVTDAR